MRLLALLLALAQLKLPTPSECQPKSQAGVERRVAEAASAPASVLVQIELARCYDQAWLLDKVEPAIASAQAVLVTEVKSQPAASPSAAAGREPILAGVEVPLPTRIREEQAEYPSDAYVRGIRGLVVVEAIVDRNGNVREATIAQSVKGLDQAAVRAVRRYKFAPTVLNGQVVDVRTFVPIRFGQSFELRAADWLAMATFFYTRGLPRHASAMLEAANDRAAKDNDRYGPIAGLAGGPAPSPPVKTKDVRPTYPPAALSAKTQGLVVMQVLIDRFGTVGRVEILKPIPMLDLAAEDAVSQWRFAPARLNGQPVSFVFVATTSFNLR